MKNNKLRKLFTKGPRKQNISWKEPEARVMEGLNDCIETPCNKNGTDKYILKEWKVKLKVRLVTQ